MNSLRISVRRAGSVFVALALLLSTGLSGIASAAQVTERSIALSTSSAGADNVKYQVNFTPASDADMFLVDFCSTSPLIGAACGTAISGFSVTGAAVDGDGTGTSNGDVTAVAGTGHQILVTLPIVADTPVSVDLEGINNPDDAGTIYARVLTFETGDQTGYTSTAPGTYQDEGGVAISITPTIAVSGAVLESLQFCVSGEDNVAPIVAGDPIGANCSNATYAPTLKLGTDVGGVIALDSQQIYEGTIYTQLSTNAASGAVVSLKSSTAGCGGLMRAGEPDPTKGCGIAPAGALTFNAGEAKFGVKLGTATGVGTSNGDYQAYGTTGSSNYYNSSAFKLNAATNNLTGVTSSYGDPLLDTDGKPLNNMNMPITFGASAAANTPAGNYSAELSLIATGKF